VLSRPRRAHCEAFEAPCPASEREAGSSSIVDHKNACQMLTSEALGPHTALRPSK